MTSGALGVLLCSGLLAVCLLPAAQADEREGTRPKARPEEVAARQILALLAAGDAEGLAPFAEATTPDPWMIADWLLSEGEEGAAEALARAAEPYASTRKMTKYVAAQGGRRGDEGSRRALAAAVLAIEAGRYAEAYPMMEPLDATEPSVLSVQIHFARGIGLYALRRRDEAMAAFAAGRESAHRIGWLAQESQILQWMAQTEADRGLLTMAIAHARARVAVEDGLAGRPRELMNALERLATALRNAGQHDDAVDTAERGLTVARESQDRLATARALVLLGTVAGAAEDYEKGVRYARQGLEMFEEARNAPGTVDALNSIGVIYHSMAQYGRSQTFLERTVQYAETTNQPYYRARAQSNLGSTYRALGEYPKSLRCFDEAIAYDRSRNDAPRVAMGLNNMAVLYEQLGDVPRARKLLRTSLKLFEAMNDQARTAGVCLNLAALARTERDWDEAADLLQRAAEIRRGSPNPRDVASVSAALGALASDRGKYAEAIGLYREALRIYVKSHDQTHLAVTQMNLGLALHRSGDSEEGLASLDRAVGEAASVHNPRLQVAVLGALALVHLELGNAERAMLLAENALANVQHLLGGLAEEESASTRAHHAPLFHVGALAALQAKAPAKVLRFLEAGRAGSLLESLGGRDGLRYAELPEALRKEDEGARVAEAKAAARYRRLAANTGLTARRDAAATLTAATERVRDVVAKIQREAKAQAHLVYPKPASLSEIQRRLAKGHALVVYGFCRDEALAVVVEQDAVRALSLGTADAVRKACTDLGQPETGVEAGPALKGLVAALVDPLGLDASVKQVLVSPAGQLCYVPFGALFEQPVTMTPSGTTHVLLDEDRRMPAKGVLALGDPAYPGVASNAAAFYVRGGERLTRLPATRVEAQNVGDTVLLGEQASEGGFRDGLATQRRWRAVHLACHGRVDHERPTLCALALTPGAEDDGFLTVHEIFRMKVSADLAVLSACETGGGRVVTGEGIVGLTRAFMYAGAPRVLCSLWKVNDEATQALMTRFYELWNPKEGKPIAASAALKQAQEYVRSQPQWKHPYYWAAWVLWGLPD